MRQAIRNHPVVSYFVLAFALSWGCVLGVILPGDIPALPADAERLFPTVYLAMLTGPTIACLILTFLLDGVAGLKELRGRLFKWRLPPRWYALALLTAPGVLAATLFVLSRFSSRFNPPFLDVADIAVAGPAGPVGAGSWGALLLTAIAVGAGAGLFEEIGWTGFAIPRVRARYDMFATGLSVGVLWGAWHLLAVWWGSADSFGSVPVPVYLLVALLSVLPPYRILMVRLYDRTGSLLLAILMHASLTASMIMFGPAVAGTMLVVYNVAFAAALWVLVVLTGQPAWRLFTARLNAPSRG